MKEYRCFFLGPEDLRADGERVYVATELFEADTDDQARDMADGMSRRCTHMHGFEIWRADVLIHYQGATTETDEAAGGPETNEELPNG